MGRQHDAREGVAGLRALSASSCRTSRTRSTCPGTSTRRATASTTPIAAFATAADNELGWMNADVLYPNGHHGHNVHFLVQALNLDGRFNDSMTRVRHLMSFKETPRERTGNSPAGDLPPGLLQPDQDAGALRALGSHPRRHHHSGLRQARAAGVAAVGHGPGARSARQDRGGAGRRTRRCASTLKKVTATVRPLTVAELELDATIEARERESQEGIRAVPIKPRTWKRR